MNMSRNLFISSILLLISGHAIAGGALGTPVGIPVGIQLGQTLGNILPIALGSALPVTIGGVLGIGAVSLAVGIHLVKRKKKL
ncbi:hypothetical protein [Nitrosomonas aestuarii]|uniref:hypothetical protein n=1 Tax=Nitrosomonas aestuarii TaxID=52441 RepID=UPI000D30DB5C|nr:hypothetical protein [Nitrosomonas aestuarii]PTN11053.1 hypothetical protein C8R11_11451 [Nitrosomonas aestuarii]